MRLKKAGIIILRLKVIDDRTRVEIEVATAEQGVRHIEMLIERRERREEAIAAFTDVIDGMIGIVDDIVEVSFASISGFLILTSTKVHPVFEVSWKAATTLYKASLGLFLLLLCLSPDTVSVAIAPSTGQRFRASRYG